MSTLIRKKDYLEIIALLQAKKMLIEAGLLKTMKRITIDTVKGRYFKYAVSGTYIKRALGKRYKNLLSRDCYFGRYGSNGTTPQEDSFGLRYYCRSSSQLERFTQEGYRIENQYVHVDIFYNYVINQNFITQIRDMFDIVEGGMAQERVRTEAEQRQRQAMIEQQRIANEERQRMAREREALRQQNEQQRIQDEYMRRWRLNHPEGGF